MARISKKTVYQIDELITMADYLVGTDSIDFSTKSYPIQGIADLFLDYAKENINNIDQDNRFRFVEHSFDIGGVNQDISTVELREAAISQGINTFFTATNLTVIETELIVFVFTISERDTLFTHERKYLTPNTITKGTYAPLIATISASDLQVIYIESALRKASPENLAKNTGNVIYDLGDITGLDYLNYINTVYNPNFPAGFDLTDNSKVFYFKWTDNGTTFVYFFNEPISMNSYDVYGYSGDYPFGTNELVLYFNSNVSLQIPYRVTKTSELTNDGDDGINPFASEADLAFFTANFPQRFVKGESPSGVLNGINATFNSALDFLPESLEVFLNGMKLKLIDDYNTSGNNTIQLSISPTTGETISINYIKL
jgi:hypothetical protein